MYHEKEVLISTSISKINVNFKAKEHDLEQVP